MKYFLLLTFILSGFLYDGAFAQAPATVDIARLEFKAKRVISPAPEAAELGKYGNTPVSLYAGTPQISIPLYELKGNMLSLPLSLNFSASGFKPQDAPTWVGQNWSLNAGGVISRAVRGNPDDATHYYGQPLVLPPHSDMFAEQDVLRDIKLGNREMEPDQYFYNFGNHSGKFIVMPDQQIIKKERDMLQISTSCISCESGSTITIVDENGNTYLFAAEEATRMALGDDPDPDPPVVRSYQYVSAWYLSSITSADGREKLTFTYHYTPENAIDAENTNNKSVSKTYAHTYILSGSGMTEEFSSSSSINGSTGPFTWARRRFLKDITFTRDGNTIAFIDMVSTTDRADSDFPGTRMLQRVDIYDASSGTNKLVKQYELGYGYYENQGNTYTKKRLRLDRLQEKPISAGAVNPPPYQFFYNMSALMPPRFSTALDHWGYFNGHDNASIVPTVNIHPTYFPADSLIGQNANREPDLDGASYGMINKIVYPTNGYTTFEYELHDANVGEGVTRILGGIRIKRIIDYAATGQVATAKDYAYTLDDGKSSGKCDELYPKYLVQSTWNNFAPMPVLGSYTDHSYSYTVTGNSIFGLGTFQGSHVGYARVTETLTNLSNNQPLGKTVYNYQLGAFYPDQEDIASGDLLSMQVYDVQGKLQQEQSNTYNYQTLATINCIQAKSKEIQDNRTLFCKTLDADGNAVYTGYVQAVGTPGNCIERKLYPSLLYSRSYPYNYQQKSLATRIEKRYDQLTDSYILNTTKNNYENPVHIYPTRIEQYTTGAEEVVTRKKYAADYPNLIAGANDAGIPLLNAKNMKGVEIESYQYRQQTNGQQRRIIGGSVTTYGNDLQPVQLFRLESNVPLASYQETDLTTAGLTKDPSYRLLGNFSYEGGVLKAQQKNNDIITAYIWNSNHTYPIAEIVNSSTPAAAFTSFEEADAVGTGWGMTGVSVNTTLAFAGSSSGVIAAGGSIDRVLTTAADKPVTVSFWLQSGAVTFLRNGAAISPRVTGPQRKGWTYYEYILPAGTNYINIRGNNTVLDELRYYPSDAQMTSYTYTPMVGITSQTSPNNLTSTFEYDGLNRLVNIKDELGNIRQNFVYNYGPGAAVAPSPTTVFYNAAAEQSFTRTDCPAGVPAAAIYKVPYGRYISSISQADANTKAQQDIATKGLAYVNATAKCYYQNATVSRTVRKNDCPPERGLGKLGTYTVEAGKWKVEISQGTQADADALAQKDLDDNTQNYVNQNGSCSCDGEGKKMINGVCETGTKRYQSSTRQPDGKYLCTYIYTFSDNSVSGTYSTISNTPCPIL